MEITLSAAILLVIVLVMAVMNNPGLVWCRLIGHRYTLQSSCHRCGMPYWAEDDFEPVIDLNDLDMWWAVKKWRIQNWYAWVLIRCSDCGKPEYIFGKRVGDHCDCIPF